MTVLQALATAGGFKDFAKTKDIRIQRKTDGHDDAALQLQGCGQRRGGKIIVLQPGDTIIVP